MSSEQQANQIMTDIKKQSYPSSIIQILSKIPHNVKFTGSQVIEMLKKVNYSDDQVKLIQSIQNNLQSLSPQEIHDAMKVTAFVEPQFKIFKALYRQINDNSSRAYEKVVSALPFYEEKRLAERLLNQL